MAPTERKPRPSRSRSAFTLVELLVVVSIIALMTSILLPSLTRAQKQGEQIHCLANQRQLTMAWMLYPVDNGDRLCNPDTFTSALLPYAEEEEVFICKGIQEGDERVDIDNSYGLSNRMGGRFRDGVRPFHGLHETSRSSERMVFVDIEPQAGSCYWPVLLASDDRDTGAEADEADTPKTWLWRPWSWPASNSLQGMTARHSDGSNMSFADGHGEYYRWRDHRTLKLIKGRIADPEEASANNPDLDHMVGVLARN
jgi:prepilin-type processing-associated H-X9-DG protein/prepilin-type N-terminal cleavage/methylation domain-containing protein